MRAMCSGVMIVVLAKLINNFVESARSAGTAHAIIRQASQDRHRETSITTPQSLSTTEYTERRKQTH